MTAITNPMAVDACTRHTQPDAEDDLSATQLTDIRAGCAARSPRSAMSIVAPDAAPKRYRREFPMRQRWRS